MTSILSTKPWLRDPEVVPIPWRLELENEVLERAGRDGSANGKTPLKFGVLWSDGYITPQPPVMRGLRLLANAVKKAGHKVALTILL